MLLVQAKTTNEASWIVLKSCDHRTQESQQLLQNQPLQTFDGAHGDSQRRFDHVGGRAYVLLFPNAWHWPEWQTWWMWAREISDSLDRLEDLNIQLLSQWFIWRWRARTCRKWCEQSENILWWWISKSGWPHISKWWQKQRRIHWLSRVCRGSEVHTGFLQITFKIFFILWLETKYPVRWSKNEFRLHLVIIPFQCNNSFNVLKQVLKC